MSKKVGIEEELELISLELNKLSKSTKLKDILKKHKDIKTHISITTDKIETLEELFESEILEPVEIIDDETYEKYTKEISEIVENMESDIDDLSVELLVKKYRSTTKKILCCEQYLNSKKLEVTYCDTFEK